MILVLLITLIVFMLPLKIHADIHHGQRRVIQLSITVCGLCRRWLLEIVRTADGSRIRIARPGSAPKILRTAPVHANAARKALRIFRFSSHARQFLLHHLQPQQLDALIRVHTGSAAATALLTGSLHPLPILLPQSWRDVLRLKIVPEFVQEHSSLQARCIFSLRLGIIAITAGLLLAEYAVQAIKREAF